MGNDEKTGTVFDPVAGETRLRASGEALNRIRQQAMTPPSVGPDIVSVAPARGAFTTFQPSEMVPGSTERIRRTGHMGRDAIRIADAFDVMKEQSRRKKAEFGITPGQISAGRDYRSLVERIESTGVKCSSMEGVSHSQSDGGCFSEAILRDSRRLASLRRRIGTGVAIEVRRIRPSERGIGKRRGIPDRAVVDMVCIGEKTLSDVLVAFGWSRSTKNINALRAALCAALDRMQGY